MDTQQFILAIVVALIGSTGGFGLIQFMINRHDNKHGKLKGLEDAIQNVESSITKLQQVFKKDVDGINHKIEAVYDHIDHAQAINSRVRILRASDEIRHGMQHSKEFYDQLSDDITVYENYCENHKDFRNNRAVQAIENINTVYQEKLKKNDFL